MKKIFYSSVVTIFLGLIFCYFCDIPLFLDTFI